MFRGVALRLTLLNAAVIVAILGLLGLGTYFTVQYSLRKGITQQLHQAASALAGSKMLTEAYGGKAVLEGYHGPERREEEHEALTVTPMLPTFLFDAQGRLDRATTTREGGLEEFEDEEASLLMAARPALNVALGGQPDIRSVSADDHAARVLSVPVLRDGRVVGAAQLLASEDEQLQLLRTLRITLLGAAIVGVVIAMAGGYILSVRALEPVRSAFQRQREFIATASHQLRTPVAIIRADAEALQRSLPHLPPEDAQLLQDMVHESQFLGGVIQQLVAIARLEGSRNGTHGDLLDLVPLVQATVEAVSPLGLEKGVTLSMAPSQPSARVKGDAVQLRLALMTLLDNAVKYNRPGGSVRVEVRGQGPWVEVAIVDTGVGIPLEEQERVFQRFYRGSGSRNQSTEGAGLGLPIAREVARAHGGDVTLFSRPGQGTTVVLRLPRQPQ